MHAHVTVFYARVLMASEDTTHGTVLHSTVGTKICDG